MHSNPPEMIFVKIEKKQMPIDTPKHIWRPVPSSDGRTMGIQCLLLAPESKKFDLIFALRLFLAHSSLALPHPHSQQPNDQKTKK
jgi:hypothetical protein